MRLLPSKPRKGQLALIDTDPERDPVTEAERVLLGLADFVYAHTPLKPMSKALFLVSRCLLVAARGRAAEDADELVASYAEAKRRLGVAAPADDFDFAAVVAETGDHLGHILGAVAEVHQLATGTDKLGLLFNTLLRGKFEGGEGLGTHLTPEEVVAPMVAMALKTLDGGLLDLGAGRTPLLFGDICGGTGRFAYRLARELLDRGVSPAAVQRAARLFDQSQMATDFARLNFAFEGLAPDFRCVGDSLTAEEVTELRGRFLVLATNPPFGAGKYRLTEPLARALPADLLAELGFNGPTADPSELFLHRNLDLLALGGVLAIVLPDGIAYSSAFVERLKAFGRVMSCRVEVCAAVSLPAVTFSLGGTVAKTSFLIIAKHEGEQNPDLYVATAKHVGFVKRGNRRSQDPAGNDLEKIAAEYREKRVRIGHCVGPWRAYERLAPAALAHVVGTKEAKATQRLADLVSEVRAPAASSSCAPADRRFHISVLDVDETGLIDVAAASGNSPATPGLACNPGDIILSCMNPRIWRVAVIPKLGGAWTCSPEFVVLRPRGGQDPWRIALSLHQQRAVEEVRSLARGTSSSRQRVPKRRVLELGMRSVNVSQKIIEEHAAVREDWYARRLWEADAYRALHDGGEEFR